MVRGGNDWGGFGRVGGRGASGGVCGGVRGRRGKGGGDEGGRLRAYYLACPPESCILMVDEP